MTLTEFMFSILSPREASAKVVAKDARAQGIINALGGNDPNYNPDPRVNPQLLTDYKQVLKAAEEHPKTVTVESSDPGENNPNFNEFQTVLGAYTPPIPPQIPSFMDWMTVPGVPEQYRQELNSGGKIELNPNTGKTTIENMDTLSHELQHFLMGGQKPPVTTDRQHKLISYLSGVPYGAEDKGLVDTVPRSEELKKGLTEQELHALYKAISGSSGYISAVPAGTLQKEINAGRTLR